MLTRLLKFVDRFSMRKLQNAGYKKAATMVILAIVLVVLTLMVTTVEIQLVTGFVESHDWTSSVKADSVWFGKVAIDMIRKTLGVPPALSSYVRVSFPHRKSVYYLITDSEIIAYSQLGWLSTILLTLFGASSGFATNCIVALQQEGLPIEAITTLRITAWAAAVISGVFVGLTVVMMIFQARIKKAWQTKV